MLPVWKAWAYSEDLLKYSALLLCGGIYHTWSRCCCVYKMLAPSVPSRPCIFILLLIRQYRIAITITQLLFLILLIISLSSLLETHPFQLLARHSSIRIGSHKSGSHMQTQNAKWVMYGRTMVRELSFGSLFIFKQQVQLEN